MDKAIIDTTVLTDILLNSGEAKMEFREKVKQARLVLVPEIRTAESRAMFGAMAGLSGPTIQRIENDPGYNPGKSAIIVLNNLIRQSGIEE